MYNPCWLVLWIITVLSFGLTLAVNYVLSAGYDILGLNFTDQGTISDKYYLDITPASWTFSIWGVIYVWQAIWMIYCGTLLCRKNESGHLYHDPGFFSAGIFVAYILNLLCNISWNFTWSLEHIQYSLMFIALVPFFLYICLIASFYGLRTHGQELIDRGQKKDVIMTIILVQNGIGIYATWVTVATLLNFAMVLHYFAGVALHTCTSAALGILSFELVLWFILDNFVFEKACRYFLITYCVVIFALIGSIEKNWDSNNRNSIFTAVLIAAAGVFLLVKIILVVIRSRREPLFEWKGSNKEKQQLA